jgi:translation initiation factor 5B
MFKSYREQMKKVNSEKHRSLAVFPCKLRILPGCVFNSRNPIVCGVRIEDGFIKLGTPICVPSKDVCIEIIQQIFYNIKNEIISVHRTWSNC